MVSLLHEGDQEGGAQARVNGTIPDSADSEPEVSAMRPGKARHRNKAARITANGTVYHTHERCPRYKSARKYPKCSKCCGYAGSMSDDSLFQSHPQHEIAVYVRFDPTAAQAPIFKESKQSAAARHICSHYIKDTHHVFFLEWGVGD